MDETRQGNYEGSQGCCVERCPQDGKEDLQEAKGWLSGSFQRDV